MTRALKWLYLTIAFVFGGGILLMVLGTFVAVLVAVVSDKPLSPLIVTSDHAVGVVELKGEILTSEEFRESLKKMVDHEKIKGIVVRIDSPGGAVGASEEIFRAIEAADQKKPVTCSLGNLAASGGLYAAVACRKIFTNLGTLTGSIGVVMMTPNLTELFNNAGVSMTVVKSGQFKDAGSPFRAVSEEDRALLQSLVETTYEQFLEAIASGRSLEKEKLRPIADGRIVLGEQAIEYGLADEVGGLDDAAKAALVLSGDTSGKDPELVEIPAPTGFMAILGDLKERAVTLGSYWSRPHLLYRLPW